MKYIIVLIVNLFFAQSYLCQNTYYSFGNEKHLEWVMRFEFIDSETHSPIQNAKFYIYDNPSKYNIAELQTDSYGVIVLLIKDYSFFKTGKFKFISPNYQSWEVDYSQYEYLRRNYSERIYFPDNEISWSNLNSIPSDRCIADKIKNRKHGIWEAQNSTYRYDGPGIYEFEISLNRIPDLISQENHNHNINKQKENQIVGESFTLNKNQSMSYQLTNITGFELEFTLINNFIRPTGEKYFSINLLSSTKGVELLTLVSNGASVKQYREMYIKDIGGVGILADIKEGGKIRVKILVEKIDYSISKVTYWLNGGYKGSQNVGFSLNNCNIIFNDSVGQSFYLTDVSIITQ